LFEERETMRTKCGKTVLGRREIRKKNRGWADGSQGRKTPLRK